MTYNWQHKNWPTFKYGNHALEDAQRKWEAFCYTAGTVNGMFNAIPFDEQTQITSSILSLDAVKTSEIEGEYLDLASIRSSVLQNLGVPGRTSKDLKAQGLAELYRYIQTDYQKPFSQKELFIWHKTLMQGDRRKIKIGAWRTHKDPIQIVSGAIGKEEVHFEGPPSHVVPIEMKAFIKQASAKSLNPLVQIAITHVYFESIHPFEDGNGRMGRAISEKQLRRAINSPLLPGISVEIQKNRKEYYEALKAAQRRLDIDDWVRFYSQIVLAAQHGVKAEIEYTVAKRTLLETYKNRLNERQVKVLKKMLDAGQDGFEGGMSQSKYKSIAKTAPATAARDLRDMLDKGVLKVEGGGRSTRYYVVI